MLTLLTTAYTTLARPCRCPQLAHAAMYRRARMHAGRARAVPVTLIELADRGCQKKKHGRWQWQWQCTAGCIAVEKKSRVWFG